MKLAIFTASILLVCFSRHVRSIDFPKEKNTCAVSCKTSRGDFTIKSSPGKKQLCSPYKGKKNKALKVSIKVDGKFDYCQICVESKGVSSHKVTIGKMKKAVEIPKAQEYCWKTPGPVDSLTLTYVPTKNRIVELSDFQFGCCKLPNSKSGKGKGKPAQLQVGLAVESPVDTPVCALNSDCSALRSPKTSGIYTINLDGGSSLKAYCDMTTDGGGWLVFQRRQDGTENFFRNWDMYREGFGKLNGEFWLGNDAIATITKQRSYELRVDIEDFKGMKGYAVYNSFSIDASDKYRLTLGEYSGNAGDSLGPHKGYQFTTFDSDNDIKNTNCANEYKGAWWYHMCYKSNLNGLYGQAPSVEGVNWFTFNQYDSLKFTEMKIRPVGNRC